MMYFKPKKKGCKIDFGKGRKIAISMSNIVEVDDKVNQARIRSMTGAVMIYYSGGVMNMHNKEIAKILINDDFVMTTSFSFSTII